MAINSYFIKAIKDMRGHVVCYRVFKLRDGYYYTELGTYRTYSRARNAYKRLLEHRPAIEERLLRSLEMMTQEAARR